MFGGDDWVALHADAGVEVPDGFPRGEIRVPPAGTEPWVKVPMSVLDGVVDVHVTGSIHGHTVSLMRRLSDGRIRIEFVGSPAVARELGLDGDQYMGWTGIVAPEDVTNIQVALRDKSRQQPDEHTSGDEVAHKQISDEQDNR